MSTPIRTPWPIICLIAMTTFALSCFVGSALAQDCNLERRTLSAKAKDVQVSLSSQTAFLGEEVSLEWDATRSDFAKDPKVLLYVVPSADVPITDGQYEVFQGPGQLAVYPASMKERGLIIALSGESGQAKGRIRFQPAQTGSLQFQVRLVALAHWDALTKLCEKTTLSQVRTLKVDVKPAKPAFAEARSCHLATDGSETMAPKISVSTSIAGDGVEVGDVIALNWKVLSRIDRSCKTPLYLMVTTDERVRFQGTGFFALAPGARGPFGLRRKSRRTRVFVPLHIGREARSGTVGLKVLQAGQFSVDWELIEIPARVANPRSVADYDASQSKIARFKQRVARFDVAPGTPHIVVQDRYSTDRPKQTIYTRNGAYEMQVFESFFRVLDGATGELVIERDGTSPRFSAGGRFVTALLEDGTAVELIDLFAGEVVFAFNSRQANNLCAERDVQGIGASIAEVVWGSADSFLMIGQNYADGYFINTLVERQATPIAPFGRYKDSVSRTVELHVDLEASTVALTPAPDAYAEKPVWHSLLEPPFVCKASEQDTSQRKFKEKYPLFATVWPKHVSTVLRWRLGARTRFGYASACLVCDPGQAAPTRPALEKLFKTRMPDRFDTEGERRTWLEQSVRRQQEYRALLAKHPTERPSTTVGTRTARNAELRMRSVRRGLTRIEHRPERVRQRLADLAPVGLTDNLDSRFVEGTLRVWSEDTRTHVKDPKTWSDELWRIVERYKKSPARKDPNPLDCVELLEEKSASIIARTRWTAGDTRIWLIQQSCIAGGGFSNFDGQLGLLVKHRVGHPEFTPFTEEMGLDSNKPVKAWMSDDGVLMVATPNRALLVYDTEAKKRLAFIENARDGDIAASLQISEDRRLLFQINSSGSAYVYRLADGARILNGYYLDDEFVFYRDDGVYASTHEGAQFVFFKFPGVEGYHSFSQFERRLHRPDVIEAALRGEDETPPVRLTAPPTLEIETRVRTDDGERVVDVGYRAASATSLAELAVFVDGRRVLARPLSGRTSTGRLSLPVAPEARWISVVAADRDGFRSVDRVHPLEAPGNAVQGRLFVIAVGTNVYDHLPQSQQLFGARRDAERFAEAMTSLAGRTYADVKVSTFLDRPGLPNALPAEIRAIAAEARPEDTIMLFAAGHGLRDRKDGRFYLVARDSKADRLADTALDWQTIGAALKQAKGRVLVFVDACHAGALGADGTNDDAVAALLSDNAAVTVVAAAKGRQESGEDIAAREGFFTAALLNAIGPDRSKTDIDGNGAIELSEIYGRIKGEIVRRTNGRQTPWIARNQMVGEVPVF